MELFLVEMSFSYYIKWQLIVAVARKLGITKVLTAENCTKLAVQALSSVVQGRGSQVSMSAGFADYRNNDVLIIRPLRDLSSTDLAVYNKLCDVRSVAFPAVSKFTSALSIESLTETFVFNLQKDFPSTINNIKRTSEKLEHSDMKLPKCCFCQSPLDTQMGPSSALSALHFSDNWFHQMLKSSESNLQEMLHEVACYGCYLTLKHFKGEAISLPLHIRQHP
ncbi:Cytoplasmic tRNA 2-thiolation protein 2-A [Bulinus truncatus]|nr:Cytoplasmic tRNA 2-thiolation protein 2-A [Bulinus truncatus]